VRKYGHGRVQTGDEANPSTFLLSTGFLEYYHHADTINHTTGIRSVHFLFV
jgi:hypothetical protein